MIALSKNPPSRFPEKPIIESSFPWWVAKLKPRQEKAFAFDLLERQIEYYLPMTVHAYRRNDSGAIRKSVLPLFPSYVAISTENPYSLLQQNRIATILTIKNQKRFIAELSQIYSASENGVELVPANRYTFQPGQCVKVISGPLRGTIGKISRIEKEDILVLEVTGMGLAMVKIDSQMTTCLSENTKTELNNTSRPKPIAKGGIVQSFYITD